MVDLLQQEQVISLTSSDDNEKIAKASETHDAFDEIFSRSIFTYAKQNDFEKISLMLEEKDFDVNERDDYGRTALHICAAFDSLESTKEILKHTNVKLDLPDYESGWTPLHRAVYFKHFRVAITLLKAGARLGDELCGDWRSSVAPKRDTSRSVRSWYRWTNNVDHEGNTPLDLLSTSLAPELTAVNLTMQSTSLMTFGKADYVLGITLPKSAEDICRPRRVESLESSTDYDTSQTYSVVSISASKYHSVALTSDGKCFTWGHGRSGRLGLGDEQTRAEPTLVRSISTHYIKQVATSENHTLVVTETGRVFSWGSSRYGQLGHGSTGSVSTDNGHGSGILTSPQPIRALSKVVVIGVAAGDGHSVCFTQNGEVYSWGSNKSGQLGLRPSETSSLSSGVPGTAIPRRVNSIQSILTDIMKQQAQLDKEDQHGLNPVLQISASHSSTLILLRARAWRSNPNPQLASQVNEVYQWGHGSSQPSRVTFPHTRAARCTCKGPTCEPAVCGSQDPRFATKSLVQVVQIAAGRFHNVALSSVGLIYTWGLVADHLGLGDHIPSQLAVKAVESTTSTPQLVEALLPENGGCRVTVICVSSNRTCAVSENGDLYTWGAADENGSLGHGTGKYQPVPKRVVGIKKAVDVACGENHTLVIQAASLPSKLPLDSIFIPDDEPIFKSSKSESSVVLKTERFIRSRSNSEFTPDIDDDSDNDEDTESHIQSKKLAHHGQSNHKQSFYLTSVPSLRELCQRKLSEFVNLRTVLPILSVAQLTYCTDLITYCNSFVKLNLDAVLVEMSPAEMDIVLHAFDPSPHKNNAHNSCRGPARHNATSTANTSVTPFSSQPSNYWNKEGRKASFDHNTYADKKERRSSSFSENTGGGPSSSSREHRDSRGGSVSSQTDFYDNSCNPNLMTRDRSGSKDLETSAGVTRIIKSVKKKLMSIEEIEQKMSLNSEMTLSIEQQEKIGRKLSLQSELRRLQLIYSRLVDEEKVRAQAVVVRERAALTFSSNVSGSNSFTESDNTPIDSNISTRTLPTTSPTSTVSLLAPLTTKAPEDYKPNSVSDPSAIMPIQIRKDSSSAHMPRVANTSKMVQVQPPKFDMWVNMVSGPGTVEQAQTIPTISPTNSAQASLSQTKAFSPRDKDNTSPSSTQEWSSVAKTSSTSALTHKQSTHQSTPVYASSETRVAKAPLSAVGRGGRTVLSPTYSTSLSLSELSFSDTQVKASTKHHLLTTPFTTATAPVRSIGTVSTSPTSTTVTSALSVESGRAPSMTLANFIVPNHLTSSSSSNSYKPASSKAPWAATIGSGNSASLKFPSTKSLCSAPPNCTTPTSPSSFSWSTPAKSTTKFSVATPTTLSPWSAPRARTASLDLASPLEPSPAAGNASSSTTSTCVRKTLTEIQAEEESNHANLFIQGNCVVDKYESAWSVGVTKGTGKSMREVMRLQEEQLQREEQCRRDAELAKNIVRQEKNARKKEAKTNTVKLSQHQKQTLNKN